MNPFVFLLDILLHLYITALILRIVLQWVRADFYNPISQFIINVTNPVVNPLRKIVPGLWGLDLATLIIVLVLSSIKTLVVYGLLPVDMLIIKIILETIDLTLSVFLYAIIIQAVLSWINPDPYSPIVGLLNSITWPILKHFRKWVPNMGGFDISPIFAIIAIMFVQQSIHYIFRLLLGG
jgi:YggT family protein